MSKVAVVYWSGTGNTQKMAEAIIKGAKDKGADAYLFETSEFNSSMMGDYDVVAFGCPAMGAEVLEETEFQPLWDSVEGSLMGKKIALFGSYGWGDGEWMRSWDESASNAGAALVTESLMINEEPDDEGIAQCETFGGALASS